MATRTKDGSGHGKDRSSTSHSMSQNIDTPNARRTHKPSVSRSPGKDNTILSEKSVPNYLKPTISSTQEAHKYLKKQKSEGSTMRRLTTRRSFEKHPPPSSSQAQKASLTAACKEKSLKTSSPASIVTSSTRTIPSKTVKTVGIGKGKNIRKETGGVKKKITNQSPPTSGTEGEEKEVVHDVTTKESKHEDEEDGQVDVFQVEDQAHDDSQAAEPGINHEACDTSTSLEEQEVDHVPEKIDDRKDENCEDKVEYEDREIEPIHDGGPQYSQESLAVNEQEVSDGEKAEEGLKEKSEMETEVVVTESDNGDKEIHYAGNEGTDVKGTEEDVTSHLEDLEPKVENNAPKDKDVRLKKEAPAAYNDVIEETASKLAEQRKSKVKALAGAFETVISLQNPEG